MNNPLSFTDPSGFFFKKLFKGVKKLFKKILKNKVLRTVASIAAAWFTGGAALSALGTSFATATATQLAIAGAAGGFVGGLVGSGGNLKSAFIGGLTGAAAGFIGGSAIFGNIGEITAGRVIAHGVVGGIGSEIQGGKFLQGFVSSAFVKSISNGIQSIARNNPIAGAVVAAVAGGVASELGGGKFANGAMTAGFAYLFNQGASAYKNRLKSGAMKYSLGDGFEGFVDKANFGTGGSAAHEVHVYKNGTEVGIFKDGQFINKHGLSGTPDGFSQENFNRMKGLDVDLLRAEGRLPKRGSANIKGNDYGKLVQKAGVLGLVVGIYPLVTDSNYGIDDYFSDSLSIEGAE